MKQKLKEAAVFLAKSKGLENLSRAMVCRKARVPEGSFAYHAGQSFTEFLRELADEGHGGAIEVKKRKLDPELRKAHILSMLFKAVEAGTLDATISTSKAAEAAGVSDTTIRAYFSSPVAIKRALLAKARRDNNAKVVDYLTWS